MTPRGLLFFEIRNEDGSVIIEERILLPWVSLVVTLGFVFYAFYSKNVNYAIGWGIFLGLDLILEWVIIYFFKQDVERKGKQVVETGSFWKGNKKYKGDIFYINYNAKE